MDTKEKLAELKEIIQKANYIVFLVGRAYLQKAVFRIFVLWMAYIIKNMPFRRRKSCLMISL